MDKKIKVKSKVLTMLDYFGIKYTIKNNEAKLVDWDSLSIVLSGKYKDSWKRWSNGKYGRNEKDLLSYFVSEKLIDSKTANKYINLDNVTLKEIEVKPVEPYDFSMMVTNPNTYLIENYFSNVRKINLSLINKIIKDLGLIVQDGRDNARFLWKNKNNELIGAEVQGIEYSIEKYGKRGTLKYVLPGSKGFFHIESNDINGNFTDIENIVLFEASIDLISFIELNSNAPMSKTMYISLTGVDTKIETTFGVIENDFGLNIENINFLIATDNDDAGNKVLPFIKEHYPNIKNIKRSLPNNGDPVLLNGVSEIIKDWNDFLKYEKDAL